MGLHKIIKSVVLMAFLFTFVTSAKSHSATAKKGGKSRCEVIALGEVRLRAKTNKIEKTMQLINALTPELDEIGRVWQKDFPAGKIHPDPLAIALGIHHSFWKCLINNFRETNGRFTRLHPA